MADATPTTITSAEDRQQRIDEQTSVGKYTAKTLYEMGVSFAGIGVGVAATYFGLLKNAKFVASLEKSAKRLDLPIENLKMGVNVIGGLVGSMISGVVLTYGHWKHQETEKLAVAEVNQDVANLVDQRAKFADTLNRQEAMIKELIAERGKNTSFTERAAEPTPAAEASRG